MGQPAPQPSVPMPEDISKVQRWLDLFTYLVTRNFPVPVEAVTYSIN